MGKIRFGKDIFREDKDILKDFFEGDDAWEDEGKKEITVQQCYLGYGYWLISGSDGREIIHYDKEMAMLPLGKFKKFDREGYPKIPGVTLKPEEVTELVKDSEVAQSRANDPEKWEDERDENGDLIEEDVDYEDEDEEW